MTDLTAAVDHPAVYSASIIAKLQEIVRGEVERCGHRIRVLDPMAGVGTIHALSSYDVRTVGVEIEPEWAERHPRTIVGDCRKLPRRWKGRFDIVVTSPDYGNRMSDSFEATDGGEGRIGYRWSLGRPLSPESIVVPWGRRYHSEHLRMLEEMVRVTCFGGLTVLNVSDFVRDGLVVQVVDWYASALVQLGLKIEALESVRTPRHRFGENYDARVAYEVVIVARKVLK